MIGVETECAKVALPEQDSAIQNRNDHMQNLQPYRSVLYIPGSNMRALEKARSLNTDAIIFDLEDAVSPEAKEEARVLLAQTLKVGGYGSRAKLIRINALDTQWGTDDVAALGDAGADGILLPKVDDAHNVDALVKLLGTDMPIWCMMETALSTFNSKDIALHPQVKGFITGTNDLAKDLRTRYRPDRMPLIFALQSIIMAARAAGIIAIDGVYNQFKDTEGLRAECEQGRDLGFDGKTLIHPAQIDVANTSFAPTDAEIDLAKRQIIALEECKAAGKGVAVVDGNIVETLHVVTAKRILAMAEVIKQSETTS